MDQRRAEQEPALASEGPTGTRRDWLHGATVLSALAIAGPLTAGCSNAAEQPANNERATAPAAAADSLYERLGGIFAIAAVVDYFSDQIIEDPIAGARSANPQLREWHTAQLGRLPGLKFMRTLWVAKISGGPFIYTPVRPGATNLGLENAHRSLRISPAEFDAVAGVLSRTLDHFEVPAREKNEVLGAFAAHKDEVTAGYRAANPTER
jgi:hemoglobin